MSEEKLYSNLKPNNTSQGTTNDNSKPSTDTDEVTYSHITIIKTPDSKQKPSSGDGEDVNVIYSHVSVPKKDPAKEQDLPPPSDSGDFSAQAKSDPVDSKSHSEEEGHICNSLRCTALLLSVCVLLLAVAVTMTALYIAKEDKHSGVKEQLDILRVQHASVTLALVTNMSDVTQKLEILQEQYDNATTMMRTLEANYTDVTQKLEILQEQYDNTTTMKRTLEANLTETKSMLSEQENRNNHLTKENTKLKTELQGVMRCADDWLLRPSGSLYYFSSDKKNWTDSRDACVAMGGHLAIIDSQQEMDFLKDKGQSHWIGLSQDQNDDWYWVDNTPLQNPKFWGPGQPDNYNEVEDCVMILDKKWNDADCSRPLKRICESKNCGT